MSQPSDRRPYRSADRRPSDRRPSDRRPGDRRPTENRAGDRRPVDRGAAERRPGDRRPADRRPAPFRDGERSFPDRFAERSGSERGGRPFDRSPRRSDARPEPGARRSGPPAPRFGGPSPRFGGDRPAFNRSADERRSFQRGGYERGSADRGPQRRGEWRPNRAEADGRPGERPAPRSYGDRANGERGNGDRPDTERRRFDPRSRFRDSDRRPRLAGRPPFAGRAPLPAPPPASAEGGESDNHAPSAPSDLIWGRHPALAVLEAGRPVHRIWCTPEMRFSPRFLQLLRDAKASGVLVEEVTWARLGQISGGAVHQGIVLQPAAAETLDLPTLIDACRQLGESPLLIAVDGLTDPQNLGAIVRSAEALGAHGMVLPQRRNAGLTGSVAKVAAGALEHLPVARVVNLNRSLDALKEEGYRVVGLAAEGSLSLEEVDLDGPLVIVTGSEGDGLSMLTRRTCDQLVRIPLRGATPSLNASVATALLLYEVARRSWMRGLRGNAPAPRLQRLQLPAPGPVPEPQQAEPAAAEAAPVVEAPATEAEPTPALEAVSETAATDPTVEPTVEPAAAVAESAPAPLSSALAGDPQGDADLTLAGPGSSERTSDGFDQDVLL